MPIVIKSRLSGRYWSDELNAFVTKLRDATFYPSIEEAKGWSNVDYLELALEKDNPWIQSQKE